MSWLKQWKDTSWLSRVNYFALQWACIRLYKVAEKDGSISGWGLLYWIKPGSGWRDSETGEGSDYVYLGKKGDAGPGPCDNECGDCPDE